ncbi:MAG: universal stress protein [Noviherbaspirillum sp.]
MSYKTVLVQVDDSRHAEPRIDTAAAIAVTQEAHLIGMAVTGVSRFLYDALTVAPEDPDIGPHVEVLRQRAYDALAKFENIARKAGVLSLEKRLVDDEAGGGFSLQARCADIVVLGQPPENDPTATTSTDFPEYVIMNCGVAGLIVPIGYTARKNFDKVLISWNASREATRALHSAIPLLQRAKTVQVVMFNPGSQASPLDLPPGGDIDAFLARHDVKVTMTQQDTSRPIGDALLSHANTLGADLLVMGCYGHSRFREILLGGATRTIMTSTPIPVLMAH